MSRTHELARRFVSYEDQCGLLAKRVEEAQLALNACRDAYNNAISAQEQAKEELLAQLKAENMGETVIVGDKALTLEKRYGSNDYVSYLRITTINREIPE